MKTVSVGFKCGQMGEATERMKVERVKTRKRSNLRERKNAKKQKGALLENEFEEEGKSSSLVKECPVIRRKNCVVHVSRPGDVEKSRENLPIVMMEQEIMEAILDHPVVIVCGETGCGKTTQVPQFLYEAGYGSSCFSERAGTIGVTQPRRVAVLATARRVAHELSVKLGQEVGFQVRHDRKFGEKSCVKFMTDGILLRELQADFLLRKYSVIVLDEAHERSLNTDILIGMLSRIIPLRQKLYDQEHEARIKSKDYQPDVRKTNGVRPLKLIIMSATLRVEDFTANSQIFRTPPPVLQVPARQFPVTVHFSKKTELLDYIGVAFKKVCAIHRKLPPGGILIFLTGQREVEDMCCRLRKAFRPSKRTHGSNPTCSSINSNGLPYADEALQGMDKDKVFGDVSLDVLCAAVDGQPVTNRLKKDSFGFSHNEEEVSEDEPTNDFSNSEDESDLEFVDDPNSEKDALEKLRGYLYPERSQTLLSSVQLAPNDPSKLSDITGTNVLSQGDSLELNCGVCKGGAPLRVLPLYAMLPATVQLQIFSEVPKGVRLVVVATNVAETSITIPGIKYVVDCGRAKEREIIPSSGVSRYVVKWISKASADQRAGRAGRTGPGHCYRLYSSAHFNNIFPKFAMPEINKAKIEGVVLVMKSMGIDKVANFPFPSQPDQTAVAEAERCLKCLSALSSQTGLLTPIGQAMAKYPISPRHSRMLLAAIEGARDLASKGGGSHIALALGYAVAVAAALSLEDPFLREVLAVEEDEVCIQSDSTDHERARLVELETVFSNPDHRRHLEQVQIKSSAEKLKKKLRQNTKSVAHAKFRNDTSDALSIANALRAYEQADDQEDFCKFHLLHTKTMHEMSKLRRQLWDLVAINCCESRSKFGSVDEDNCNQLLNEDLLRKCEDSWQAPSEKKLNTMHEDIIRKAICAGWADQVARRLSFQERANLAEIWKKRKGLAYRACSCDEPVFLHPSSAIAKEAPEFVVYNELLHTSRIYMRGVTRVDAIWLARQAPAQCLFSKAVADPPPWYDCIADEVMCWVTPSFGPHLWNLPLLSIPMKKGKHRTAVFAAALLQGKVLPTLGSLHGYLKNDTSILLKPESQALKRVSDLMSRLSGEVDTRSKLRIAWDSDVQFLYTEILSWVQKSHQAKVKEIWKHCLHEAQQSGEELYGKPKAVRDARD